MASEQESGYLNEPDLIEECSQAISNSATDCGLLHYYPKDRPASYQEVVMAVINVLIRRGLLNDLGIQELRKARIKPL